MAVEIFKPEMYEPIVSKKPTASLFPVRDNEPEYAKLHDPVTQTENRYGNPIVLAADGGVSLKIFAGVMLGILFYALNGLFSNLGVINAWPPFASATAPSALFLLAAIGMLWWVERR